MGLDVGIMNVRYLERPHGIAYEFAWELAHEASSNGYMTGEGGNWAPFTQRQVLRFLDRFAAARSIDAQGRDDMLAWVRSLPWQDWQAQLQPDDGRDAVCDYTPVLDNEDRRDGGIIELHFNW